MRKNTSTDLEQQYTRELEVRPRVEANEYYLDIANKFKTAKFIVLIFLIVFILSMISVFRSDITLENCRYLVRFFSSGSTSYQGGYDAIYYDTEGVVSVDMFNSDLVTLKNSAIDLYNVSGSNTVSYKINYVSPTLVTEGKYMLAYDLGGKRFDIFNNFSQLSGDDFEYPITGAAVSREGKYAVVTKSLEYKSVIYLYDHNFKIISKIFKDKYTSDLKINAPGDKLLLLSFIANNGTFSSEIMTCSPYSSEANSTISLDGEYALSCGFFANGGFGVLSDRALSFYDSGDNKISEFQLGNIVPTKCLFLDNYVVLTYNKNIVGSQSEILVFAPDGSKITEATANDKILSAASFAEDLYLLLDNGVFYLNMSNGETLTAKTEDNANGIFVYDKNNIVISYSNMAKTYKVSDLFAQTEELN